SGAGRAAGGRARRRRAPRRRRAGWRWAGCAVPSPVHLRRSEGARAGGPGPGSGDVEPAREVGEAAAGLAPAAAHPPHDELPAEVVVADLLGGDALGLEEGVEGLLGAVPP